MKHVIKFLAIFVIWSGIDMSSKYHWDNWQKWLMVLLVGTALEIFAHIRIAEERKCQ